METFVAIDFSYSLTLTFSFKFNKYFFKDLCFLGMFTILLTAFSMRYLLQIAGNQKNEHQIFIQNSKKRSHAMQQGPVQCCSPEFPPHFFFHPNFFSLHGLFHLKKYIQSLCHYSRQTGGEFSSKWYHGLQTDKKFYKVVILNDLGVHTELCKYCYKLTEIGS